MNCVIIERPFNTRKEDVTMRLPTQTVIQMYQDNLFRIAFSICQNREDAEDVVQETFLRYHSNAMDFNDEIFFDNHIPDFSERGGIAPCTEKNSMKFIIL